MIGLGRLLSSVTLAHVFQKTERPEEKMVKEDSAQDQQKFNNPFFERRTDKFQFGASRYFFKA